MGGSGGGTSYGMEDIDADALRDRARRDLQQQELLTDINSYLAEQLTAFNDRDTETVNDRLEQIAEALGEAVEGLDRLLFGGSIAKHTYVDGLSDVDALIILRGNQPDNPDQLIAAFADALRAALPKSTVADIQPGRLAVTVTYTDGTQIQLLPARRTGETLSIASEDGRAWRDIRPRKFAEKLTEVNQTNNGLQALRRTNQPPGHAAPPAGPRGRRRAQAHRRHHRPVRTDRHAPWPRQLRRPAADLRFDPADRQQDGQRSQRGRLQGPVR